MGADGAARLLATLLVGVAMTGDAAGQEREWRDVAYASASPSQRLDLYLPAGEGPFPLVVWVHGGAWRMGSKQLGPDAVQRRVLDRGFALASIEYRLSDEAVFPAQIHDVKAAIRFLRANRERFRLDADRIAGWGDSAGGHLVALLGTSAGVTALEGSLGNAGVSSRIQAVVDWYGPTDFLRMDEQAERIGCGDRATPHTAPDSPESLLVGGLITERPDRVRAADPTTYVDGAEPPFLIQHGTADCVVPYPQSVLLRDALHAAGVGDVELDLLESAGHGGPAFAAQRNMARVLDFLDRHLGG